MAYIDGFLAAVPIANKDVYRDHSARMATIMRRYGALHCVETWGDDVPEGKVTSFPMAVQRKDDEAVVFSWVWWPDKATRDAAWKRMMDDAEMSAEAMPFDGKRMIFGGFEVLVEA
ncbi:RNA signal recognition particle 4.5S ribosomal RNA [Rubellimicrobium mesophilum DSM 19309]|uniref:RNA signal recognition particle 4.5S ribosomal RNA n=1 Tax=Rubellimicrobium mesophilum DSM 19309 TaxID=442562 RepID=A0A017HLA4_9RHOB|nr:DUF1428 domain-containing protein [Rubellimicrobium mesophilum]EYD75131.1 RNA signal recognition particle 4.5S ribosomal RNA [Rubellimicrobium mesophilum DSM 19309]